MDWFLYDNGLRHERVKGNQSEISSFDYNTLVISWRDFNFINRQAYITVHFTLNEYLLQSQN